MTLKPDWESRTPHSISKLPPWKESIEGEIGTSKARVEEYSLKTRTGKHVCLATRVIFENGRVVEFLDKMPKGQAIKQALEHCGGEDR